ncbi:helix-turn-helix domain-containing protein [Granulicella aggregans]|jgi:hypothetical protein|uniref:helix-turn-helix domain-containing protein n=1 Tax=Granulicella aggregans TaxID=474949 RepID=UPI0021E04935|nr:helix-turn-helix domain-containing protein [Granulicella aggregans]
MAEVNVTERKGPSRVTLPQVEELLVVGHETAEMLSISRSALVRGGVMSAPDNVLPRMLTVSEVATFLSVSDDTILKQFGSLPGVVDIGTSGGLHLRQKRVLRIPQRTLERYIADRQVKVRR